MLIPKGVRTRRIIYFPGGPKNVWCENSFEVAGHSKTAFTGNIAVVDCNTEGMHSHRCGFRESINSIFNADRLSINRIRSQYYVHGECKCLKMCCFEKAIIVVGKVARGTEDLSSAVRM